jgi:ribosome-associated protein
VTISAPTRKTSDLQSARLRSLKNACWIAKAADDLRGRETLVLDLTEVTPIADYFVISTGSSGRQMRAVADEVRRIMRSTGSRPHGIEGENDTSWILLDFGDIVLHVFSPEARKLYDLEHLWADAPRIDWKSVIAQDD